MRDSRAYRLGICVQSAPGSKPCPPPTTSPALFSYATSLATDSSTSRPSEVTNVLTPRIASEKSPAPPPPDGEPENLALLAALNEAKRVTKDGGFILVAYVMNEYAIISYCFKKGKILDCIRNKTLTDDFHAITKTEKDLYSYTRIEDMDALNKKAGLVRDKIFAPDGAADYMRRELNALDEESFGYFVKYQLSVCERPDLLGASSHTVDVLRVPSSS